MKYDKNLPLGTGVANVLVEFKKPVKIYDADKKQLLATFESAKDAAAHIGVTQSNIFNAIRFKSNIKPKTNKLGLRLAIR